MSSSQLLTTLDVRGFHAWIVALATAGALLRQWASETRRRSGRSCRKTAGPMVRFWFVRILHGVGPLRTGRCVEPWLGFRQVLAWAEVGRHGPAAIGRPVCGPPTLTGVDKRLIATG